MSCLTRRKAPFSCPGTKGRQFLEAEPLLWQCLRGCQAGSQQRTCADTSTLCEPIAFPGLCHPLQLFSAPRMQLWSAVVLWLWNPFKVKCPRDEKVPLNTGDGCFLLSLQHELCPMLSWHCHCPKELAPEYSLVMEMR